MIVDYVRNFAKPEDLSFKASNKPTANEEKDNDFSESDGFLSSSDEDEPLDGMEA